MTKYKITSTGRGGVTARKDGEIAFADLTVSVAGQDVPVRIQTRASDTARPIFTIDDDTLVAHGGAAEEVVDAAASAKSASMKEEADLAAQLASRVSSGCVAFTDDEIKTGNCTYKVTDRLAPPA